MRLLDSKSIILGLGIGIIITSLLGVIFFAGYEPQLSDANIAIWDDHLKVIAC